MSLSGRILYLLWHRPRAMWRQSSRIGGPLVQWRIARERAALETAVDALTPCPLPASSAGFSLGVHLLTGKRYVHQTALCLHTLARHCPAELAVEIYDDGSLDSASANRLRRLHPTLRIHACTDLTARLDAVLPASRFPYLRERRQNYPHLRKLTDIHAGRLGWRLVLDSDLLFWREPSLLLEWSTSPIRPLHATDCSENYGYPRPLLERIAGVRLPHLINVGLCGLRSDAIDWEFLEHATSTLIREVGTSYYLEQALVALLAARQPDGCIAAPANDYLTMPDSAEITAPTAVMHHYVDTSRPGYYLAAWRRALG